MSTISGVPSPGTVECARLLIKAGIEPDVVDGRGDSGLLLLRHLLYYGWVREALSLLQALTSGSVGVDVNRPDSSGRTLLTYSVCHGDRTAAFTRHLLNSGARVWFEPVVAAEASSSAFRWYLKAVMADLTNLESSGETLRALCMVMGEDMGGPASIKGHVDRTMLEVGYAPKIIGPIFVRIREAMAPFMSRPHSLSYQCVRSVRRSLLRSSSVNTAHATLLKKPLKRLGPSSSGCCCCCRSSGSGCCCCCSGTGRVGTGCSRCRTRARFQGNSAAISVCQLGLPHKLKRLICLEEVP